MKRAATRAAPTFGKSREKVERQERKGKPFCDFLFCAFSFAVWKTEASINSLKYGFFFLLRLD